MTARRQTNSIAYRDLLMGMNLMLTVLLGFIIMQVNPKAADAEATKAPGNMVVTAAWPDGPTDVDLWVSGPGEAKPVGYSNRGGKLWNLLRDDLGRAGDIGLLNYESAFSRGLPAGEYTVNLHCYSCAATVPVSVEIRFGAPGMQPALFLEVTLELKPRQERTVVTFRLDANGKIVHGSVDKVYRPLRVAKEG